MAISYTKVNWDTTKYVNPTNMNKMDNGIKSACDGVDRLDGEMAEKNTEISEINTNLSHLRDGGKNLFDTYIESGGISSSGEPTAAPNRLRTHDFVKVNSNSTYTVSLESDLNTRLIVYQFDSSYTLISTGTWKTGKNTIIETVSNVSYVKFVISKSDNTNLDASEISNVMVEPGSTKTEYEPYYEGTVELTQKVNNRDLDMLGYIVPSECPIQNSVSGNVFTQNVGRVDLGSLDWELRAEGYFRALYIGVKMPTDYVTVPNWLYCEKYETDSTNNIYNNNKDKTIGYRQSDSGTSNRIWIRDNAYTDETAFKTAMQGVYLYYELATPVTKQIDGNEIVSEINTNLQHNENGGMVGLYKKKTYQASEMPNVTSGTVGARISNGVITILLNNVVCTKDTALIDISDIIGSGVYFYDQAVSGIYIDNSRVFVNVASTGYRTVTFVK